MKWCILRTSVPRNSGRDRIPETCDRGSTLFEERLEKGVIRRARARGLLCLDARDGEAVAGECYRRLLASESPLSV